MEKVTVTKVVKFANKVTEVTHTVEAGTEAVRSRGEKTSTTKRVTALDTIIDGLKGPTTVSTVEKTSFDWEKYKTEKGITEDVEKYTKDGYLTKQDFLNRVDLRQFEMEKERELQRIKRDAELAKKKRGRSILKIYEVYVHTLSVALKKQSMPSIHFAHLTDRCAD